MCKWRKSVIASMILLACMFTGCAGTGEIENEAVSSESSTKGNSNEEIQQDIIEKELSEYLASYTEDMSRIYEGIDDYNLLGLDNMEGLSEEEQIALYNEKYDYYRKSAYYEEITAYWEGIREVTDVSNLELPLYETDKEYLIKEELADVPPVVIHLAKNEIYARHGYIFTDEDLYNYFMGCMWYEPVVAPENFTDEVFNEYEKANLELLAELDTL